MPFLWRITGTPPSGVPAVLAEATAAVGADLAASSMIRERFPDLSWSYDPAERMFGLHGVVAKMVDLHEPVEMTALVADLVVDELTGYQFIQWPPCPLHSHPMGVGATGDAAWWRCPATRELIARIGSLRLDR